MKKTVILILLVVLSFFPSTLDAQGVSTFTVTRTTGITYVSILVTGSAISSWRAGGNLGDNRSFPVPIGFSFSYLGVEYSTASVSLNGFIDFSSNAAAGNSANPYGYNNAFFSEPAPAGTLLALAPYYMDLICTSTLPQSIRYLTTGTAGNRIFTVEWINIAHQNYSTTQKVNFQVKLYESTGDIEFIYGNMAADGIPLSYTCGINSANLQSPPSTAQLLTQQTPNAVSFSNNPQNTLSSVPESNTKLTFTGCILPSAAGTITGTTSLCAGTTGITYTVPAIPHATGYNWILPTGFTIVSGANTNSITVNASTGASSGDVMVNGTNSCGDGLQSALPVTVSLRPVPVITGVASACAATTGHTYTTQPGMSGYQWTISSGGTIIAGSSTNTVTVAWNTAGSQSVSVNYTNTAGCNALTPASFPVSIYPRPTPAIAGPDTVCVNIPGQIYSTEASMTSYQWALSPGGTITAGGSTTDNTITITWTTVGNRWVSVNYTNSVGCPATASTSFPVTVFPAATPTLFGPSTACVNSTGNIYTTQEGMQNYTWTIASGGTIITPVTDTNQVEVSWNSIGNQVITVTYETPAGCQATAPASIPVTVYARPVPAITGPASACAGTGGHTYTTDAGMSNYQWNIPSGGTIISGLGTNTVMVAWTTSGSRSITVNYTNPNGCAALNPVSYPVTVFPQPVPLLSGPTPACQGTGGHTYTTDAGMTAYLWDVSAGNTITGGGSSGDNYVTVTWNESGSQGVMVNYTNPNGCIAQTATTFPVMIHPVPQPTITGPAILCINTSGHVYSTEAGMTNYTWTVSAGGTITAGSGTEAITVTWSGSGTQTVSVNYMNANGCSANVPPVYTVQVEPLPVPVITGPASACQGTGNHLYTTAAGMTGYQWTISNGGTITAGGTSASNTATVTWDSLGAQTISVSYTSAIGCPAAAPTSFPVTIHPIPEPTVTGQSTACLNSGTFTYSTQTGMSGYQWTISAGGIITAGAGTAQIGVSWIGPGAQWVAVNYTNNNGCTAVSPASFPVTVESIPGQAGAITGTNVICGATAGVPYTVSPVSFANSYIWTVPPGAVIATGAGTNAITVDYPETASGGILTVTPSNGCGNGPPSPNFPVTFTPTPPVPVITLDGDLLTSTATAGNQWFRNDTLIAGATGQSYMVTVDGEYWTQLILNGCAFDTSNHIDVIITGLTDGPEALFHLRLFPNPTNGELTVHITSPVEVSASLRVINELGATIRQYTLPVQQGTGEHAIDLSSVPPGIYSLIFTASGRQIVERVVVK